MMKGNNKMKKVLAIVLTVVMLLTLTACTEKNRVSYNVSKEADNFNVQRKITVVNVRTDKVLFELEGTFCLDNSSENELEVICEVGHDVYKKNFIYLNQWTTYVVEDISGANVDKFHYELNILPQMVGEITTTSND